MTPIFSSAEVSLHTYNFWKSSTAKYIEITNIKTIKNTYNTHTSIKDASDEWNLKNKK